jgi:valyl-tRNA synthetase
MGWPERTPALARFYPTSVLVTAFDIIFFWVARMMMMGLRFMGEVPFRDVYIHAIVRDAEGQKMSKSKGNVIDPLTVIDEFGCDAFRFTLAAFAAMGRDVRLSNDRIAGYRNFINKLWNAARFVEIKREGVATTCRLPDDPKLIVSKWIRSRLASAIEDVREAIESYRFNDAAGRIYTFIWHEYCDWYIEIAKIALEESADAKAETLAMLTGVLEQALRLLHPIAPFVTEELWQSLPAAGRADGSIMRAAYPEPHASWRQPDADAEMEAVIDVVRSARNIRSEMNIPMKADLDLWVGEGPARAIVTRHADLVKRLGRIGRVHIDGAAPHGSATAVAASTEISIPIAEHVDLKAEAARLKKEIQRLAGEIGKLEGKLGNASFIERAPVEVVEKDRARLQNSIDERTTLERSLERVVAMGGAS